MTVKQAIAGTTLAALCTMLVPAAPALAEGAQAREISGSVAFPRR